MKALESRFTKKLRVILVSVLSLTFAFEKCCIFKYDVIFLCESLSTTPPVRATEGSMCVMAEVQFWCVTRSVVLFQRGAAGWRCVFAGSSR